MRETPLVRTEKLSDPVDLDVFRHDLVGMLDVAHDELENASKDNREAMFQRIRRDAMQRLFDRRHELQTVFQTSSGSVYFVSRNGQSLRFNLVPNLNLRASAREMELYPLSSCPILKPWNSRD